MKILKILYLFLSVFFLIYLILPSPDYPEALSSSRQSTEPADVESDLRRGYYTDLSRSDVMDHYHQAFSSQSFGIFILPTYRLNYPPEEAQTIIRDQTRSTFLEELVHPFRESIFVNGFEPTADKDVIVVDGYKWRQKIIVKYFPSSVTNRLLVGTLTLILGWLLIKEWCSTLMTLPQVMSKSKRILLNAK